MSQGVLLESVYKGVKKGGAFRKIIWIYALLEKEVWLIIEFFDNQNLPLLKNESFTTCRYF